jgi:2-haloacid dehalogenase
MLDFSQYRVLTFDCYGTLIDWERGILNGLRPVLDQHGITLSDDEALELFGELESEAEGGPYLPYREVLTVVLAGFAERLGFTLADVERLALAESVGDWPPFPDTVEGLGALARHYDLVILSNVDDDLFARSAQHLKVDFANVITAQQVGSYKPNRRNFEVALERVGVPKEQVLHVAQSLFHDIEPANEIGLTTVWVNRRHDRPGFGATPPASAQPDLEVPDLRTLARLVDEQRG